MIGPSQIFKGKHIKEIIKNISSLHQNHYFDDSKVNIVISQVENSQDKPFENNQIDSKINSIQKKNYNRILQFKYKNSLIKI